MNFYCLIFLYKPKPHLNCFVVFHNQVSTSFWIDCISEKVRNDVVNLSMFSARRKRPLYCRTSRSFILIPFLSWRRAITKTSGKATFSEISIRESSTNAGRFLRTATTTTSRTATASSSITFWTTRECSPMKTFSTMSSQCYQQVISIIIEFFTANVGGKSLNIFKIIPHTSLEIPLASLYWLTVTCPTVQLDRRACLHGAFDMLMMLNKKSARNFENMMVAFKNLVINLILFFFFLLLSRLWNFRWAQTFEAALCD